MKRAWLSQREAAHHLGVSDTTLRRGLARSEHAGLHGTTVVDVRSGPDRKHRWRYEARTIDAWWAAVMLAPTDKPAGRRRPAPQATAAPDALKRLVGRP